MRIEPLTIAILLGICSCERAEHSSKKTESTVPDPVISAAQLTLAKNHLAHNQPAKALPYLHAASQGSQTSDLLTETLSSARFSIPTVLLRHPFPILHFTGDRNKAIFVALGGKRPTVIRWESGGTPGVSAVLFPTEAREISHLSLSRDGLHIVVHRDATNLLCDALTLKPIANLGTFPTDLDPETCQPFTANGLLMAHPVTAQNGNHVWHIRDTATGEILHSASLPRFPETSEATFDGTDLIVIRKDRSSVIVSIRGGTRDGPTGIRVIRPATPSESPTLDDEKTIVLSQIIPAPEKISPKLLSAISGYELDPATQSLSKVPIPNRLEILSGYFPETIPPTLKLFSAESAINLRLAAAYPEEFPDINAPARAHAEIIRRTFATGESTAILAVIDSAQPGLPLSTALYLALESGNHSFIERAAAKAKDMPKALRSLIRNGTESIPDPLSLRLEQDWLGYESPDFTPLFLKQSKRKSEALSLLSLPEHPSPEDIDSLILKIFDPQTEIELGRPAIAESAIQHATKLATNPELANRSLKLSAIAQRLGSHPAACLRTNATAHTTLSDFESAHTAWIDLITNQPEAAHLSSDYTEAAYTAFEIGDAPQAMEILRTGLFRFPNDPSSSIRSGWIALLTDHNEDALRYLNHAAKLGLPPAEIENTTALLAITHFQLADPSTATSYLAQLKAISPKWNDAHNIKALPWPESFKKSLREIISREPETEHLPSPENDPTDTAPRSEGFPIEEPPLPSR